jgi:hypothetical protein
MSLLLYVSGFAGILFAAFGGPRIVYETVKTKYHQFREVNHLVSSRYKSLATIIWVSCSMIAKMYWMNIVQWANTVVEHIDSKNVIISYVVHGKLYKMHVKMRRGPTQVLLVTDQNGDDVTDEVLPFFGPAQDWHGRSYTPSFWTRNLLNFEMASGEAKMFKENEKIDLSS